MNIMERCDWEDLIICLLAISAIVSFYVAGKLFNMGATFLRHMGILKQPEPSLAENPQQHVLEVQKTTDQISNHFDEMVSLVNSIRNQQLLDKTSVKDDLKLMNESLYDSLTWLQDEECKKNEQRHTEMMKMMSLIKGDIDSLKEITRTSGDAVLNAVQDYRRIKLTKTNREIAASSKIQVDKPLEDKTANGSPSKQTLRKVLNELQKEIKTYATKERDELMSRLDVILIQISDDREIMKNTVQQALGITSYQDLQSFEKFGVADQEVLHYMTEKSERSSTLMNNKFQEFDKKLNGIFDNMKTTSFDVSIIKSTLDNIDCQLDDIFQRIELGCQKNTEQCEEVLGGLEAATDVWKNSTSQITHMAQTLSDINHGVEHLMNELKERPGLTKDISLFDDKSVIGSVFDTADQKMSDHYGNLECFLKLQNIVQSCTKKIADLEDRIENGSSYVKMEMDKLLRQIRFTFDLLENIGERYKFSETETYSSNSQDHGVVNPGAKFQGDMKINAASNEIASNAITFADNRTMDESRMTPPKKKRNPSKRKTRAERKDWK